MPVLFLLGIRIQPAAPGRAQAQGGKGGEARFGGQRQRAWFALEKVQRAGRSQRCLRHGGLKCDKEMTIAFKIGEFCSAAMRRE